MRCSWICIDHTSDIKIFTIKKLNMAFKTAIICHFRIRGNKKLSEPGWVSINQMSLDSS